MVCGVFSRDYHTLTMNEFDFQRRMIIFVFFALRIPFIPVWLISCQNHDWETVFTVVALYHCVLLSISSFLMGRLSFSFWLATQTKATRLLQLVFSTGILIILLSFFYIFPQPDIFVSLSCLGYYSAELMVPYVGSWAAESLE